MEDQEEKWFDIPEFKGLLQISNLDRVREYIVIKVEGREDIIYINRILSQRKSQGHIKIQYKNKTRKLSRLKAETFLKNFTAEKYIEYKDGNPDNLDLDNLIVSDERKCEKGQGSKNWQAKLNDEKILSIVQLIKEGKSAKYISEFFGICLINVYRIAQKKIWKHVERPYIDFRSAQAKLKRNKK